MRYLESPGSRDARGKSQSPMPEITSQTTGQILEAEERPIRSRSHVNKDTSKRPVGIASEKNSALRGKTKELHVIPQKVGSPTDVAGRAVHDYNASIPPT
jgi:hypothetical protein